MQGKGFEPQFTRKTRIDKEEISYRLTLTLETIRTTKQSFPYLPDFYDGLLPQNVSHIYD